MKLSVIHAVYLGAALWSLSGCHEPEEHHEEPTRSWSPARSRRTSISTQQYVCQIHSRRHIEVRALEGGYLEEIPVKEGQAVKKGDLMFKILPTLYQAKLDAEVAEAQLAQIEFNNTKKLFEQEGRLAARKWRWPRPSWPRPRPR